MIILYDFDGTLAKIVIPYTAHRATNRKLRQLLDKYNIQYALYPKLHNIYLLAKKLNKPTLLNEYYMILDEQESKSWLDIPENNVKIIKQQMKRHKVGIVSNNGISIIRRYLDAIGCKFNDLKYVCTREAGLVPKPFPDMFKPFMKNKDVKYYTDNILETIAIRHNIKCYIVYNTDLTTALKVDM